MSFRILLLGVLSLVLAAGGVSAAPLSGYNGADAGWLVFSITTDRGRVVLLGQGAPPATDVTVDFRRVGDASGERVHAAPSSLLLGHRDFSGPLAPATRLVATKLGDPEDISDRGDTYDTQVLVLRLPPGDYEIVSVNISGGNGSMSYWARYNRRRLPFHIAAGRALYLGALTPAPRQGKGLFGLPDFDYWNLLFDDERERDTPIAQHRTPDLGPVDDLWQAGPQQTTLDAGDRSLSPGGGR